MKKFMTLVLASGLILASAGLVFAASSATGSSSAFIHTVTGGLNATGDWPIIAAGTAFYFDDAAAVQNSSVTTKAYQVLGSSGVHFYYNSTDPNFYVMGTISDRGDKCYGSSQSSTIIAMHDEKATGKKKCSPTMPTPAEVTVWPVSDWTKTDGSPLPQTMTAGSQTTP